MDPADGGCVGANCGPKNSPFTNVFPINGVGLGGSGKCNADGLQLMPGSLKAPACEASGELDLDYDGNGKLVGKQRGQAVCPSETLRGATFAIRGFANSLVELKIAEIRQFDEPSRPDGGGRVSYEGYRILGPKGKPACDLDGAREILSMLGVSRKGEHYDETYPEAEGYEHKPEDELVIAMAGPLFHQTRVAALKLENSGQFFNLACVGDALAKAHFFQLDKHGPAQLETALKMITANYCGHHLTVRGMPVNWRDVNAIPTPASNQETEARWKGDKAVCLSHPRLMGLRDSNHRPVVPYKLPRSLQPRGCASVAGSLDPGTCDEAHWTEALIEQCNVTRCISSPEKPSTADFESSVKHEDRVGNATSPAH